MATNQPTAKAEATYPSDWGVYWTRRMEWKYTIRQALVYMIDEGMDSRWVDMTPEQARHLEVRCMNTQCSEPAPCKCPRCL